MWIMQAKKASHRGMIALLMASLVVGTIPMAGQTEQPQAGKPTAVSGTAGSPSSAQNEQTAPKPPEQPVQTQQGTSQVSKSDFLLEDGTPVKLRFARTVSSSDAKPGETVDLEVLEEVKIGDLVVIPQGGIAWATVTEAEHKKRLGRGGKLNMNIDNVRLANGQKAPLKMVKEARGGGHVGAMTGAIVATAIVFWPAAPLFLFMHGKDITVPKGTAITAYIAGNVPLDRASFVRTSPVPPEGRPEQVATVTIVCVPVGADIEVDGSFVASTPSTIKLVLGEHVISVKKKGYKTWERKLNALEGAVNISVELEPDTVLQPAPTP